MSDIRGHSVQQIAVFALPPEVAHDEDPFLVADDGRAGFQVADIPPNLAERQPGVGADLWIGDAVNAARALPGVAEQVDEKPDFFERRAPEFLFIPDAVKERMIAGWHTTYFPSGSQDSQIPISLLSRRSVGRPQRRHFTGRRLRGPGVSARIRFRSRRFTGFGRRRIAAPIPDS